MNQRPEKRMTKRQKRLKRLWLTIRPAVVLLVSLAVVFLIARTAVDFMLKKYKEAGIVLEDDEEDREFEF